jgi:hypothetical protein
MGYEQDAPTVQGSVSSGSLDNQPTSGSGAASDRGRPTPPIWVNSADGIGPCSLAEFARLMGSSTKTIYRQIKEGLVWKGRGPGPKRFFFHLRDKAQHRLFEARYAREKREAKKAK